MEVKSTWVLYSIVSVVILSVYISTLSPSIAGGDSGEIVAEGCHLGTAHPPGYPLITLIIHALSKLSFEDFSVAYRINLFCAVCTTVSALLMGIIVRKISKSSFGGDIIAMGLFAFSPLIWQYANTAEVFPLNTLFASFILYLVIQFTTTRNMNYALFGAFICGLAMCNQHTIVLFIAPLILWMLFLLRNYIKFNPYYFIQLSISFVIGCLPYLYLPLAAFIRPQPGSWGHVVTMQGLLHHILRKDYGTFQLFR